MIQLNDAILAAILASGGHPDVPMALSSAAHWKASLLLAARSWSTIGGFTSVAKLPDGRFIAPIDGMWVIAFQWDYDVNRAFALQLKKLGRQELDTGDDLLA